MRLCGSTEGWDPRSGFFSAAGHDAVGLYACALGQLALGVSKLLYCGADKEEGLAVLFLLVTGEGRGGHEGCRGRGQDDDGLGFVEGAWLETEAKGRAVGV